ncbi:MAG: hypothetical protein A2Y33_08840 [Spirochaetes bacterium GWF1_51_8]|nr:MAG: hypothetical protein A2Y33_08840 [Spirochaetes bacterium GWF1_51_8]
MHEKSILLSISSGAHPSSRDETLVHQTEINPTADSQTQEGITVVPESKIPNENFEYIFFGILAGVSLLIFAIIIGIIFRKKGIIIKLFCGKIPLGEENPDLAPFILIALMNHLKKSVVIREAVLVTGRDINAERISLQGLIPDTRFPQTLPPGEAAFYKIPMSRAICSEIRGLALRNMDVTASIETQDGETFFSNYIFHSNILKITSEEMR